jgi:hypothetical protein
MTRLSVYRTEGTLPSSDALKRRGLTIVRICLSSSYTSLVRKPSCSERLSDLNQLFMISGFIDTSMCQQGEIVNEGKQSDAWREDRMRIELNCQLWHRTLDGTPWRDWPWIVSISRWLVSQVWCSSHICKGFSRATYVAETWRESRDFALRHLLPLGGLYKQRHSLKDSKSLKLGTLITYVASSYTAASI